MTTIARGPQPAEAFEDEARDDLIREFITSESGNDLDEALENELLEPLKALGRAAGDRACAPATLAEVMSTFQDAVEAAALRYANSHLTERTRQMEEDQGPDYE